MSHKVQFGFFVGVDTATEGEEEMVGNRIMNRLSVGLVGLLLCWATMVQAAVPEQISYQGRLTDAANVALDGAYLMVFSLWDVDTGGVAALWFEQQTVTVTEGIYNVQLGAVVPFPADLLEEPDRFIQVEIFTTGEGWEVLTPRQPLTSVPFAMHAAQANSTIDGAITAAMLANEAVSTEKLVDGAVTAAKVTGGFVPDLDADMLDGLNATSFAPAAHNHDTRYYTQAHVDALETRIAALEAKLQYLTVVAGPVTGMPGPHLIVTGANLHLRSGSGSTGSAVNGLGNLIVGYNEIYNGDEDRGGSHNVVIGRGHQYSSYGGLVAGSENSALARNASVTGGYRNTANGSYSTVSGGYDNTASGNYATITGGFDNTASGDLSLVGGGMRNTASGPRASIIGGQLSTASGQYTFVGGGGNNYASGGNHAYADYSAILGGAGNVAGDPQSGDRTIGSQATVSGGENNTASGVAASVSGGRYNTASGQHAHVAGGGGADATDGNQAFGNYSSILGGFKNIAGDPALSDHLIGQRSSVSGGLENKTTGEGASVGGGWRNTASGPETSVSGGFQNDAQGGRASVTGGRDNVAIGSDSTVSGGSYNTASSGNDSVVGDTGKVYVDSTPVH